MRMTLRSSLFVIGVLSLFAQSANAQISKNPDKFLGNITTMYQVDYGEAKYYTLWNQITPENESKWASVEGNKGTYNWQCETAFSYAKSHNFTYKFHALIWGAQYPSWFNSSMSVKDRYNAIVKWFDAAAKKYPDLPIIDVVNEAVGMHQQGNPLMKESLGGGGKTGYDWLIKAFELAHERWPNAILIYNDYNTFQWDTDAYINLVRTLRDAGAPIDAYGCQSHELKGFGLSSLQTVETKIQNALKMPMYITEYDIQTEDDNAQLNDYKVHIPYFWEKDYCAGITLWGYIYGKTWNEGTSGIIKYENNKNTERKAMTWLREYMASEKALNAKSPFPGMKKQISLYIKPSTLTATKNDTLSITINAKMVSAQKSIDSIRFYVNNKLDTVLTSAPYIVKYVPAKTGKYELKAVAFDNDSVTYERYGSFTAYNPRSVYNDTIQLPGTIEAEYFDNGGDGVSYHDNDAENRGNANFRTTEGVDIDNCTGGRVIGYTNTDEWLEYTVYVNQGGYYNYEAVVSSDNSNGSIRLSVNDGDGLTDITDIIKVPNTTTYTTYKSVSGRTLIQLKEGLNIIRLTITGGNCNVDKVKFTHVNVDKTLNCTIAPTPSPATVSKAVNMVFNMVNEDRKDAVSKINVFWDGQLVRTVTNNSFKAQYYPTTTGVSTISAIVIDTLGNESDIITKQITVNKKRSPYSTAISIPGILQAENFDKGGEGLTFHDADSKDEGNAGYRTDNEGVDIVKENNGYAIGYTSQQGEWLEYTVNVATQGKYAIKATVCTGLDNAAFKIGLMNGTSETRLATVSLTNNGWGNYYTTSEINLTQELQEGQQVFRITVTGIYCNIDKIEFILKQKTDVGYILEDEISVPQIRYNLSGVRVDEYYKGPVIINGKTYLIDE